jgi:subtilisin family serine protease
VRGGAAGQAPGPLEAIPGVREHSGRVVVALRSEASLVRDGVGRADARAARARVVERLEAAAARELGFGGAWVLAVAPGDLERWVGEVAGLEACEFVEPDWIVFPTIAPNDPRLGDQWQHATIDSERAWDVSTGLPVIVCAACDSGVDLDHPDLMGALVPGVNTAVFGPPEPQIDGGDVEDLNGHGTFVGGCMAAIGNNGIGVTGVGWDLSLMPVRVSNRSDGSASLSNITEGAVWAVQNGARVANASYTGVGSSIVQSAGQTIREAGGLLFWAAGNDGRNLDWFDHPDVVVVGSTTQGDSKSGFSAYGLAVDVFAPGSGVWSTRRGGGYGGGSGTSYATPIAAGAAALIWSVDPSLTPAEVEQALFAGCDDLGDPGEDDYWGHGRVNVGASAALVSPPAAPPGPFGVITPAPGSVATVSDPLFSWSASPEAGWYELVVDDDPSLASPAIETFVFGLEHRPPFLTLEHDTTYHVSLIAHNPLGSIEVDGGVYSFTVGPLVAPGAFDLLAPADGATGVSLYPTASWDVSARATGYRLVLDDDADLSSPLIDEDLPWTQRSRSIGGILDYERTYYWAVWADNASGTTPSTPGVASFTTEPYPEPGYFGLMAPAPDAVGVPTGPTLEWSASWLAESYRVEIDDEPGFPSPVYVAELDAPPGEQEWKIGHATPAGTLAPETAHVWRVLAIGPGGERYACAEGGDIGRGDQGSCVEFGSFTTAPAGACAGDVNGDGATNVFDFAELADHFGEFRATREQGDLTGDGSVDVFDFAQLADDYGCGS